MAKSYIQKSLSAKTYQRTRLQQLNFRCVGWSLFVKLQRGLYIFCIFVFCVYNCIFSVLPFGVINDNTDGTCNNNKVKVRNCGGVWSYFFVMKLLYGLQDSGAYARRALIASVGVRWRRFMSELLMLRLLAGSTEVSSRSAEDPGSLESPFRSVRPSVGAAGPRHGMNYARAGEHEKRFTIPLMKSQHDSPTGRHEMRS